MSDGTESQQVTQLMLQAAELGARQRFAVGDYSRLARAYDLYLVEYPSVRRAALVGRTIQFSGHDRGWWWDVGQMIGEIATRGVWEHSARAGEFRLLLSASFSLGFVLPHIEQQTRSRFGDHNVRLRWCQEWYLPSNVVEEIWSLIGPELLGLLESITEMGRVGERSVWTLRPTPATASTERGVIKTAELIALLDQNHLVIDPRPTIDPSSPDPWIDLYLGYSGHTWDAEAVAVPVGAGGVNKELSGGFTNHVEFTKERAFMLEPGQSMNALLLHRIELPPNIMGTLDGRSVFARRGLSVAKASQFKPGWRGYGVLELTNHGYGPVELHAEMPICQMLFTWL